MRLTFHTKNIGILHPKFVVQKCLGHNDFRDGHVVFISMSSWSSLTCLENSQSFVGRCVQALQPGDARDSESPVFDLSSS